MEWLGPEPKSYTFQWTTLWLYRALLTWSIPQIFPLRVYRSLRYGYKGSCPFLKCIHLASFLIRWPWGPSHRQNLLPSFSEEKRELWIHIVKGVSYSTRCTQGCHLIPEGKDANTGLGVGWSRKQWPFLGGRCSFHSSLLIKVGREAIWDLWRPPPPGIPSDSLLPFLFPLRME